MWMLAEDYGGMEGICENYSGMEEVRENYPSDIRVGGVLSS